MAGPFRSFDDFWPFYLGQHAKPGTRLLHTVGTTLALLCLSAAIVWRRPAIVALGPVLAYGCAWIGHFFVEGNRPATFGHPLWSLRGDFKMYALILSGRIGHELDRLRIR